MASVSKRVRKGLDLVCVERAKAAVAAQAKRDALEAAELKRKWVVYGRKLLRALDLALPPVGEP